MKVTKIFYERLDSSRYDYSNKKYGAEAVIEENERHDDAMNKLRDFVDMQAFIDNEDNAEAFVCGLMVSAGIDVIGEIPF